ncbi:IpaC/SipC family type III secretion system effector [Pseudomonas fuscovaginae UPB0736]|uniref:IpaC/SipC family type III secretion system effector n=1 Tax=Pseudomonas asplenii TaxID=53407 RepID=UPI001E2A11D1|nr:IpaC/SipC family type III secretion system effector [Pseudomonas fuscovaginae]UUQ66094.1 IpaC/SipC family type III secretion system effector [Pseudomonas fuscovaginae UPB0736]
MLEISAGPLMQPVTAEVIPPESPATPSSPLTKSALEGALLQDRLDRQVTPGRVAQLSVLRSSVMGELKRSLEGLGFSDVQLAALTRQMDEQQLETLRTLGSFGHAEFVSLIGQLDDQAFQRLTDVSEFSEADLDILRREVARQAGDAQLESSGFDPRVWEQHVGVLLTAIIALNIARVANAQLRGHFSVMAANAAVEQGKAIREGGNASLYAALGGAMVAGALSVGGLALTLKSYQGKHADIVSNKREALNAGRLETDLRRQLRESDKLNVSTPEDRQAYRSWLEDRIIDAGKRRENALWLSELGSRRPDRLIAMGTSLNSMAMVISNVLSAAIRLDEIAQHEREVLQQSNQNVQKSLADEENQVDARDTALLQKLLDIIQQITQSRNSVIEALVRA